MNVASDTNSPHQMECGFQFHALTKLRESFDLFVTIYGPFNVIGILWQIVASDASGMTLVYTETLSWSPFCRNNQSTLSWDNRC